MGNKRLFYPWCYYKINSDFCVLPNCPGSGNIRLVGGTVFAGRVEVFIDGEWGTVCDDEWDILDATVACNELGFPGGAVASYGIATFGEGSGAIHLDDLQCLGSEDRLQDCARAESHNCQHSEDAAVMCRNPSKLNEANIII